MSSYVGLTVRIYEPEGSPEEVRVRVENALAAAFASNVLGAGVEVELEESA